MFEIGDMHFERPPQPQKFSFSLISFDSTFVGLRYDV